LYINIYGFRNPIVQISSKIYVVKDSQIYSYRAEKMFFDEDIIDECHHKDKDYLIFNNKKEIESAGMGIINMVELHDEDTKQVSEYLDSIGIDISKFECMVVENKINQEGRPNTSVRSCILLDSDNYISDY
jgi:hypothetical protein